MSICLCHLYVCIWIHFWQNLTYPQVLMTLHIYMSIKIYVYKSGIAPLVPRGFDPACWGLIQLHPSHITLHIYMSTKLDMSISSICLYLNTIQMKLDVSTCLYNLTCLYVYQSWHIYMSISGYSADKTWEVYMSI